MSDKKENKKGRRSLPTRMSLVIRIVAGVYLLYLAYSIYNNQSEVQGAERFVFGAAMILFVVFGAVIAGTSLRAMQKGEYAGGAGDSGRDREEEKEKKGAVEENAGQKRIRFGEPETLPERKREETAEGEEG